MRSIARQKHAAIAELVGQQATTHPVFFGDDVVLEIGIHTQNVANRLVTVNGVKLGLGRV